MNRKEENHALLHACEAALRAGRPSQVATLLRGLNPQKVPRSLRLDLANVSRRAGLFVFGLRLLSPVVRDTLNQPRAQELAEYAVLLMKIGSIPEAIAILNSLDSKIVPEKLMYLGFCEMNRWDYQAAIDPLTQYLQTSTNEYQIMVAKVNLVSALVHSQRDTDALQIIDETLLATLNSGFDRLRANLHELRAQVALNQGRLHDCMSDVRAASCLIGQEQTTDQLYIRKWEAVLTARQTENALALDQFRKEALARNEWESVREADFQLLKIKFSEPLYQHLWWGTPSPSFRQRLLAQFNLPPEPRYILGQPGERCLDLQTGILEGESALKCGQMVHMVLRCLTSDFYAPMRIGTIFSHLFPDEYFHHLHSTNRVHQLLWRTRGWLRRHKIPVDIAEIDGRFALRFESAFGLLLEPQMAETKSVDLKLEQLRRSLPESFSRRDVERVLGISEATARRLIRSGIDRGHLVGARQGRTIVYKSA